MFTNPNTPNQADFTTFVYNQGVSTSALPTTSDYLTWAFNYAFNIALEVGSDMPGIVYSIAVYNLGFHQLLTITPDQNGQNYFTQARQSFNLLGFVAGVISGSSDEGTSQTIQTAEWMNTMTLSSLGLLKTPWGRAYLEYAQQYGPNIVGVS